MSINITSVDYFIRLLELNLDKIQFTVKSNITNKSMVRILEIHDLPQKIMINLDDKILVVDDSIKNMNLDQTKKVHELLSKSLYLTPIKCDCECHTNPNIMHITNCC